MKHRREIPISVSLKMKHHQLSISMTMKRMTMVKKMISRMRIRMRPMPRMKKMMTNSETLTSSPETERPEVDHASGRKEDESFQSAYVSMEEF